MPLDFPSSPTNGQVYGNYYYNSARGAWNALLPAATPNFFTNATLNTSTLVDATATASAISTVPLIINGLSGQTANIQEWKSNGVLNAFVNSYGGAKFVDLKINTSSSLGSLGIIPGLASQVGVVVRGTASQTANLQEWQNSSGTAVSYIAAGGSIYSPTGSQMGSSYNVFQNSAAVHPVVVVKGYASQTGDLQQWQSSTGAVLSEINSAGELQVPRIGVGSVMPTTTMFQSTASAVGNIPVVARGAASQTANLQEWQNSAGTSLASVSSSGTLTLNSGGGELQIKAGGSLDHAYLEFYARTALPSTRSAYFGYPSNGSNNLTISNEITNGNISFLVNGTGQVALPANTYIPGAVVQAQHTLTRGFSGSSKSSILSTTSTTFTSIIQRSIVTKFANSAIFVIAGSSAYTSGSAMRGKAQLTRNGTEINADAYAYYTDVSTFAFHQFSQLDYPAVAAGTTLTYSYNAASFGGAALSIGYGDSSGGPSTSIILLEVAQ